MSELASRAWDVAAATPDPELPTVTIGDLGILRAVEQAADGVVATITPTYSGCPAMREITADRGVGEWVVRAPRGTRLALSARAERAGAVRAEVVLD